MSERKSKIWRKPTLRLTCVRFWQRIPSTLNFGHVWWKWTVSIQSHSTNNSWVNVYLHSRCFFIYFYSHTDSFGRRFIFFNTPYNFSFEENSLAHDDFDLFTLLRGIMWLFYYLYLERKKWLVQKIDMCIKKVFFNETISRLLFLDLPKTIYLYSHNWLAVYDPGDNDAPRIE